MSTRMNEADWANTLEVFRACLPRRGRKAADDRLFLEAMHFFTVENVRWRALPERFVDVLEDLQGHGTVRAVSVQGEPVGGAVDNSDVRTIGAAGRRRSAHLGAGINRDNRAGLANSAGEIQRQKSSSGTDIRHGISRLRREGCEIGKTPP